MKIVVYYLGRKGGAPVYGYQMARALAERGHQLLLILSSYSTNIQAWRALCDEYSDVQLLEVKTYKNKLGFVASLMRVDIFYRIIKRINCFEPDAVYSVMTHSWDYFIFPYVKTLKIKTIHDVKMHLGDHNRILQLFHDISLLLANKIILLSKVFVDDVVAKGVNKNDIVVIPHANYNYYSKLSLKGINSKRTDNQIILFFGRIVKYKGLDILLNAFEEVLKIYPSLMLRIVGNGDITEYQPILLRHKSNIEICNEYIPDEKVSDYFMDVKFVVLPYVEATQSGIIPLSFSFGKPVVATKVGGIPEQIYPNTGILVDPNNIQQLVDAILTLMSDNELLELMSREALRISNTTLSWSHSAELLEAYIKKWITN